MTCPYSQPAPHLHDDSQPVYPLVEEWLRTRVAHLNDHTRECMIAVAQQRVEIGKGRYQQELHTHNGRDVIEDLKDELIDAIFYSAQAQLEGHKFIIHMVDNLISLLDMVLAASYLLKTPPHPHNLPYF